VTPRREQTEVFENRMLRSIFGPKRVEMACWKKLHNEELRKLYSAPRIIRMMKSRMKRWEWHVAQMGVRGMHIGY
jgi:hypothetical protein